MPFTFSHPAAVIPLKRCFGGLSFPALIAGSVIPDFEYFVRMKSRFSHTWQGIFWMDIPLSLLVLFVFFYIVRDDFIDNLPKCLQGRLQELRHFDFLEHFKNNTPIVIVSIALGAFTHVLWDSFTHASGAAVSLFPVLKADIFFKGFPVYRLCQHISTVLGGMIIVGYIYRLPEKEVHAKKSRCYFPLLAIHAATGYFVLSEFVWKDYHDAWHEIIISISAILLALCMTPIMRRVIG